MVRGGGETMISKQSSEREMCSTYKNHMCFSGVGKFVDVLLRNAQGAIAKKLNDSGCSHSVIRLDNTYYSERGRSDAKGVCG